MSETGRCLCGSVTVQAKAIHPEMSICHCSMCRTWSGGPYLGVSSPEGVSFSGREFITEYPSSEWANRGFCRQCGTHLYYYYKTGDAYYMPAGLFPDLTAVTITSQIFVDEKPAYYDFANECKMLTGKQFMEMFANQTQGED